MASETDICNLALGMLGGAGDTLDGNAFIDSIDGTDKVSEWCKISFPRVRRTVITDLAIAQAPFRSTVRFADLGDAIDDADLPEIGNWTYAFDLPALCLAVVSQFSEGSIATRDQRAYGSPNNMVYFQWETIANKDGDGKLLLTDNVSNDDSDSAFIEYVIDTTATTAFSENMIDCIATLLASKIAPVVGQDMKTARAMLLQYEQLALPKAKKVNVTGFNNSARRVTNYRGGRSNSIGGL